MLRALNTDAQAWKVSVALRTLHAGDWGKLGTSPEAEGVPELPHNLRLSYGPGEKERRDTEGLPRAHRRRR